MGGTEHVSFEFFLGILRGPGEGRGGAPGTVPLQNPEVTSRKACLRNAEASFKAIDFSLLVTFLLVTFSWLFRGFSVAFSWPSPAWKNSVWAFFVVFSWLFLGKFYAYSP